MQVPSNCYEQPESEIRSVEGKIDHVDMRDEEAVHEKVKETSKSK